MKSIQDDPSVIEARTTLEGVTGPLSEVEREQHELRSEEVTTFKDDLTAKAKRFLSGKGMDAKPQIDTRKRRLMELEQQRKILVEARDMAEADLGHVEREAGRELMKAAGADLERLAQEFATAFSDAALKAKVFKDFREQLEEGGIGVSAHYPAIALGRLDLLDRNSWLNRVLTDLETDYNVSISRDVLE